jgi:hypothetical protein
MTLVAGTTLGPYEIVAPLGAGGMGRIDIVASLEQETVERS